jgi:hypothetical protein
MLMVRMDWWSVWSLLEHRELRAERRIRERASVLSPLSGHTACGFATLSRERGAAFEVERLRGACLSLLAISTLVTLPW